MKPGSMSPIIYDYLRKYQEDPTSRIFAPLAEAYRKAGLIDEAIEIAKEGLQVHPSFIGGRVALARALFDKGSYEEVLNELAPVVRDVPDNLVAQRLLAESCLMLGRLAEALGAYKMLLYFTPGDQEIARLVQELEVQAYEQGALVLRADPAPQPAEIGESAAQYSIERASKAIDADPRLQREEWMKRIEFLQMLLQKVEKYRLRYAVSR